MSFDFSVVGFSLDDVRRGVDANSRLELVVELVVDIPQKYASFTNMGISHQDN